MSINIKSKSFAKFASLFPELNMETVTEEGVTRFVNEKTVAHYDIFMKGWFASTKPYNSYVHIVGRITEDGIRFGNTPVAHTSHHRATLSKSILQRRYPDDIFVIFTSHDLDIDALKPKLTQNHGRLTLKTEHEKEVVKTKVIKAKFLVKILLSPAGVRGIVLDASSKKPIDTADEMSVLKYIMEDCGHIFTPGKDPLQVHAELKAKVSEDKKAHPHSMVTNISNIFVANDIVEIDPEVKDTND